MFSLLRHYAITSFVGIVAAAVLLTALYRHLEVQESVELVQKNDLAVAENVLNSVRLELNQYLESVSKFGSRDVSETPFPTVLASNMALSMRNASVASLKIFNDAGIIVFSTESGQIGTSEANQRGYLSARNGSASSDLLYHDTFNTFNRHGPEDNLVQTYIPVRRYQNEPIRGVLAISTDFSPQVAQNEQEVFAVIGGIAAILAFLYCVLFLTVLRAQKIIATQQATISERTKSLETLSAQLLNDEEIEKKKLASELLEDLSQTLSAIRIRIDDSLDPTKAKPFTPNSLTSVASALQGVVEELQQTAMELRPSSLDDLGLLPTLDWFFREFEQLHAGTKIERQISLGEEDIPGTLKLAVYRIVEKVFKDIAAHAQMGHIRIALNVADGAMTLAIDGTPRAPDNEFVSPTHGVAGLRERFLVARERTTLSGGIFSTANNRHGGVTMRASWTMPAEFARLRRARLNNVENDTGAAGSPAQPDDQISAPAPARIPQEAA
jgi:signal transduction histidine kinase